MRCILICLTVLLSNISCKKTYTSVSSIQRAVKSPIANAGEDTTIVLPSTHATLDGGKSVDPDNGILTYKWRKISGPDHNNLDYSAYQNPATSKVGIDCYDAGESLFELTVANDAGLFSKDTVKITVVHSAFADHPIDYIFDSNCVCQIAGTFPGIKNYDAANFRFNAKSHIGSEEVYIDQEYEKIVSSYFYPATLTLTNGGGSIFFNFFSDQNFFTLPYNSQPANFSDSVVALYGVGMFANISKHTRLYCSGTADTANHKGKIILKGSLFY